MADTPSSDTTYVLPSGLHTYTMIFLHGREDFGDDLAENFFDSKSSTTGKSLSELFPTIKFVFPTAKMLYSAQRDFEFTNSSFAAALKGEEIISQWFDVWDLKNEEEKQHLMIPGLQDSIQQISNIIKVEVEQVPAENILLGGISQGCVAALYTLLASHIQIGGFIGLSSWLPFERKLQQLSRQAEKECGCSKDASVA
jgi:lysophospholipase-2